MGDYFDWEWIKGYYFDPWLIRFTGPRARPEVLEAAWKAGFQAGASEYGSDLEWKPE